MQSLSMKVAFTEFKGFLLLKVLVEFTHLLQQLRFCLKQKTLRLKSMKKIYKSITTEQVVQVDNT